MWQARLTQHGPSDPHFHVFIPLYNPLPLKMGWPRSLLLTDTMLDSTSMISLRKIVTFLLLLSVSLLPGWIKPALILVRLMWQETEDGPVPSQKELSPYSTDLEELNPVTNYENGPGNVAPQLRLWLGLLPSLAHWVRSCETLRSRGLSYPCTDSWATETVR